MLRLTPRGARVNATRRGTIESAVAEALKGVTTRDRAATRRILARLVLLGVEVVALRGGQERRGVLDAGVAPRMPSTRPPVHDLGNADGGEEHVGRDEALGDLARTHEERPACCLLRRWGRRPRREAAEAGVDGSGHEVAPGIGGVLAEAVGMVEQISTPEGFEVIGFQDGPTALEAARKMSPHLIIADYHLDNMTFSGFCKEVHRIDNLADTYIVSLISASDRLDETHLRSLGVKAFLKKPFQSENLLEVIKGLGQRQHTGANGSKKRRSWPPESSTTDSDEDPSSLVHADESELSEEDTGRIAAAQIPPPTISKKSTASPPPEVKKIRLRSPGAQLASRSASWIALGWA